MKKIIIISILLLITGSFLFAGDTGTADLAEITTWELIKKGGWLMIPIALCSLIVLAYSAERFINLRQGKIMPSGFLMELTSLLEEKKFAEAKALCRENDSSFAHIILSGLREIDSDWDRIEKSIEDTGAREISVFRQNVRPLKVVSEIAPLIGLLGTIQGMMGAFQNVSSSSGGGSKTEMFAGDIFLALVTTAAGLTVAIPALFLFYFFAARIDKIVLKMDMISSDLLDNMRDNGNITASVEDEKIQEEREGKNDT